ncbi:hypothetical protein D9M69_395690 [compost metagenome]
MTDAGDDQIRKVFERDQAAPIMDSPEWQGNALVQPTHHVQKVGSHTRTVNEHRTDDHHFHPAGGRNLAQPLLGLHFRNAIRIARRGGRVSEVRLIDRRTFAIDLDRTDEHKATNTQRGCLPCEAKRAFDIHLAKRLQRIGFGVIHDVNASRAMNDNLYMIQRLRPVGISTKPGSSDGSNARRTVRQGVPTNGCHWLQIVRGRQAAQYRTTNEARCTCQ